MDLPASRRKTLWVGVGVSARVQDSAPFFGRWWSPPLPGPSGGYACRAVQREELFNMEALLRLAGENPRLERRGPGEAFLPAIWGGEAFLLVTEWRRRISFAGGRSKIPRGALLPPKSLNCWTAKESVGQSLPSQKAEERAMWSAQLDKANREPAHVGLQPAEGGSRRRLPPPLFPDVGPSKASASR